MTPETQEQTVLAAIVAAGPGGITHYDIEKATDIAPASIRRITQVLRRKGFVRTEDANCALNIDRIKFVSNQFQVEPVA